MEIRRHGGGCCGIDHIVGFQYGVLSPLDVENFNRRISNWKRRYASRMLEACLTDSQMRNWAPHLQKVGFKLGPRFRNSNSRNIVNVLHLLSARQDTCTFKGTLPRSFEWKD